MRNIKEILRLKWLNGVSARDIAKSCGIPRSTVGDCLQRATAAKLSWPLPEDMNDTRLEHLLYPQKEPESGQRPLPDRSYVHEELKRKGVTLSLLWQEYKAQHPEGFQYSRFCDLHRAFAGTLSVSMRQTHLAGEKLFVDYAGPTIDMWIEQPVRYIQPRCLSQCWAHRTTPSPKRP